MRFVILQNGSRVVGRYDRANEARERVLGLLNSRPGAIFEVCIVSRRVYMEVAQERTQRIVDETVVE